MKKQSIFITGTDTNVGKSVVTGLLGRFLQEQGKSVITQKWVQTGDDGFSSDVNLHLDLMKREKGNIEEYISKVAPYILKFSSSPHLAAQKEGISIEKSRIIESFHFLSECFDCVIAEGSGGVMVPINQTEMIIDIAAELEIPTVIVGHNRLGAINHTLLTVNALESRKINIIGIILNRMPNPDDESILLDNLKTIEKFSKKKVFGDISYCMSKEKLYNLFIPIAKQIFDCLVI